MRALEDVRDVVFCIVVDTSCSRAKAQTPKKASLVGNVSSNMRGRPRGKRLCQHVIPYWEAGCRQLLPRARILAISQINGVDGGDGVRLGARAAAGLAAVLEKDV